MDVTVVVLHHGLSETLLSSCVPQLELVMRGETRGENERLACRLFSTAATDLGGDSAKSEKEEMNT